MHRRDIIKKLLLGTSLTFGGGGLWAFETKPSPVLINKVQSNSLYLFTKVLQWVPLVDLPKVVQDLGFTGIDIAVRGNGHFQVKELKEKLPQLVASSQSLGMEPPILTTELTGENIRDMDEFLRIVSGEGLKHYRLGWVKYKSNEVMKDLNAFNSQFKNLAELHQKYQVQGHYQNHTGSGVGGSVWELLYLLEGILR
ncbi:MAG: hypothetical protein WD426_00705 [Anditalea sp.]